MKIKTLIVDDEPHARLRVRKLTEKHPELLVIGEARNGREAIDLILKNVPDVIFLDIQMPDMNGFDVIAKIDELKHKPNVVFTTAYDEYALKAFDVHALDYILKPIDVDRFEEAVNLIKKQVDEKKRWFSKDLAKYYQQLKEEKEADFSITVQERSKAVTIYAEEIIKVNAEGNYSEIITANKKVLYRSTLSDLFEKLSAYPFIRVHRKNILNTKSITNVRYKGNNEYEFLMSDNSVVRSGRSYKELIDTFLELKEDLS